MAAFPKTESEIWALALRMVQGFKMNLNMFPHPPVMWPVLNIKNNLLQAKRDQAVAALAALEAARVAKDKALDELVAAMKQDIRYAENITDFDDEKLRRIGWHGKPQPRLCLLPGQPLAFEIEHIDDHTFIMSWKVPADGGKVTAYNLQCRSLSDDQWQHLTTCLSREYKTGELPRGELEFCVIAVNKAGQSLPSNSIAIKH